MGVEITFRRDDRCDTCADIIAANNRRVPDFHIANIGDCVHLAGFEDANYESYIASTRSAFLAPLHIRLRYHTRRRYRGSEQAEQSISQSMHR
jgi:hypothetical protein